MKKNEVMEVIIDKVDFPNKGIAITEGGVVKFKGGIEGQKVTIRTKKWKKNVMESKILETVEKSPIETQSGCAHYKVCGGCTYQTLAYETELEYKKNQIQRLFEKEELDINLLGIESSPVVNGYRNKMEYTFGDEEKDGPLALGLHMKGRFYEVVNTWDCNIIHKDFSEIREAVRRYFDERNIPFYNSRKHDGVLRHLVIRRSETTKEILLNLVTSSQMEINTAEMVETLLSLQIEGEIKGILHTINDGLGDVVKADKIHLLYGQDYITEEILGLKFKNISIFFFPNKYSWSRKALLYSKRVCRRYR